MTGSVASLVYGEPRLTHDIDLVVALLDRDAERLKVANLGLEAVWRHVAHPGG